MVRQVCGSPRKEECFAGLLLLAAAGLGLFVPEVTALPVWRLEEEALMSGVLIIGIHKDARSHVLHLSRNKRYTLTPEKLKWDKFKLTYKLLSFPRNLLNASDTRRGITKAFSMWSDVSPFSFREVPSDQEADIKIGFYSGNHTDCLQSYLHHCFDGITGELAHAFFPQTGEIHFDDDEYWILGNMRFSWNKGVWLTDLVHVAAHEIGHVLGLMHSQNRKALMHLNATLTGRKLITQDEDVWIDYLSVLLGQERVIVTARGYSCRNTVLPAVTSVMNSHFPLPCQPQLPHGQNISLLWRERTSPSAVVRR
ncbi:matrix metalloproteinase-23 isoform X5 [Puntigrus tetrazona]|uniref:matrix metalloproteinase-23 isoform X5 n=1 Tax=Puntigrus tetrazona TaxID=1606681 RepID=UPI001C8AB1D5|nr:matrix metalloproteinase-23 isoform X5 [Puntigrus tetrazona]